MMMMMMMMMESKVVSRLSNASNIRLVNRCIVSRAKNAVELMLLLMIKTTRLIYVGEKQRINV